MKFTVCPDPNNPSRECNAASILEKLVKQGRLKSYNPNGFGNCFEVAIGLLTDIAEAGVDTNGWCYVQAECKPPQGLHAWLEYDGWIVDFSSGKQVFATVSELVRVKEPRNLVRLTFAQLERKLRDPKGRKELGIFGG